LAAVPGLLLFGAFTLWKLFDFTTRGRVPSALGLTAAILLSTWFVSLPQRDPSLWALEAYNSGWQALESKNLPLAEAKLERAYRYVPENTEINLALGNLWLERKNLERAEGYYRAVLELDPHHKAALTNLGWTALEQHQGPRAVELFRAALGVAPTDAKAHYLLARALFESGDKATAKSEISAAIALRPNQSEFTELQQRIERDPPEVAPNEQ
jgi:tetratricopeptide (TPR) repeat protein